MKRKTYNNVVEATKMIQKKGYSLDEANEMAIRLFDENTKEMNSIEFYNENGNHMEHCGECISGFNDNPLKRAVERAKWWNCKSICIVF